MFIYIKYSLWEKRVYKYNGKKALESIFRKMEATLKKIGLGIKNTKLLQSMQIGF